MFDDDMDENIITFIIVTTKLTHNKQEYNTYFSTENKLISFTLQVQSPLHFFLCVFDIK